MKKPLNYYGLAFEKPGEGYNDEFLASEEGKLTIKKKRKKVKRN